MIIAFAGLKRHGKSTATEMFTSIAKSKGKYCSQIAFADPLREVSRIMGFTYEEMNDPALKEKPSQMWGKSWRQFATWFGTECIRKQWDRLAWVKLFEKELLRDYSSNEIILVTDVRFDDEAALLKKHGAIIFEVYRPSLVKWWHKFMWKHASERGISRKYIDSTITNNDDLFTLQQKIQRIYENTVH
jgi:hypothetical protein